MVDANEPTGVEGQLGEADLAALREQLNRQNQEMQQRALAAEQRAQELEIQAQTADMDEEEKWKYMSGHYQRQLGEMRQQLGGMQQLMQAQERIAGYLGINPGHLDPTTGWEGMMEQAGKIIEAERGRRATPATPQPTPTAPTSDFQEWASGDTWAERQKKVPKGRKAFAEWMEKLSEE